jgi:hypothetical protein
MFMFVLVAMALVAMTLVAMTLVVQHGDDIVTCKLICTQENHTSKQIIVIIAHFTRQIG